MARAGKCGRATSVGEGGANGKMIAGRFQPRTSRSWSAAVRVAASAAVAKTWSSRHAALPREGPTGGEAGVVAAVVMTPAEAVVQVRARERPAPREILRPPGQVLGNP